MTFERGPVEVDPWFMHALSGNFPLYDAAGSRTEYSTATILMTALEEEGHERPATGQEELILENWGEFRVYDARLPQIPGVIVSPVVCLTEQAAPQLTGGIFSHTTSPEGRLFIASNRYPSRARIGSGDAIRLDGGSETWNLRRQIALEVWMFCNDAIAQARRSDV